MWAFFFEVTLIEMEEPYLKLHL
ncbi:hypothetical protein APK37_36 [Acinetobacter phage APK37.1]|uniref:Uncharacterized protein n=1 Tax=Acinetobacter phage APK37.1 TaxID=2876569 RepID=A0AAE8XGK0_9CAUD|nr:hypothetical protein APK37_36 [Acinetobacter phage APK37.1]